jgi:bacillopeptidase F
VIGPSLKGGTTVNNFPRTTLLPLLLGLALILLAGLPVSAAPVPSRLATELDRIGPGEKIPVIVRLAGAPDLQTLAVPVMAKGPVRAQARAHLIRTLRGRAEQSRAPLRPLLQRHGVNNPKELWLINGLALDATAELIAELAARPEVASINYDEVIQLPRVVPAADSNQNAAEDNLDLVNAPALWAQGFTGQGVTVAIVDSGVDVQHPDLATRWRGGSNSWFNGVAATCSTFACTPCDANTVTPCDYLDTREDPQGIAHGTGVAGVAVGGNAGGTAIGVAPGAQWIAAKIFRSDNTAPASGIHAAAQWLLDPDGNPATDDAPDIVNGSWGIPPEGNCFREFEIDVQALKNAGIAVAFAAGNSGPAANTSISPGNYPASFAVGSVGNSFNVQSTVISDFSGRGPSPCDNSIFPEVVAPGFVRTADFSSGGSGLYVSLAGTSFSTPHATGVMALLLSALPGASVADLENALTQSATDLGTVGPDNAYGFGLLDAQKALDFLTGEPNIEVTDSLLPAIDRLLAFGHVAPGTAVTATLLVRNAGSAPLALGTVDISGVAAPFAIVNNPCNNAQLPAGGNCTITVRFAPTAFGPFSGAIGIPSSDPDEATVAVNLSGIGNTPPVAPQPLAPASGATVGTTVTFSWLPGSDADGDALSQRLIYSPHSDFSVATTVPLTVVTTLLLSAGGLLVAGLGAGLWGRRWSLALLLAGAALALGLFACGGGGGGGSALPAGAQSTTVTGLARGVTYFWKLEAEDSRGAITASAVRTILVQ